MVKPFHGPVCFYELYRLVAFSNTEVQLSLGYQGSGTGYLSASISRFNIGFRSRTIQHWFFC